jgi:hypothetical protein
MCPFPFMFYHFKERPKTTVRWRTRNMADHIIAVPSFLATISASVHLPLLFCNLCHLSVKSIFNLLSRMVLLRRYNLITEF